LQDPSLDQESREALQSKLEVLKGKLEVQTIDLVATEDAIVFSKNHITALEDAYELITQQFSQLSFLEALEWTKPFVEHSLTDMQTRLGALATSLEKEFPSPMSVDNWQRLGVESIREMTTARFIAYGSLIHDLGSTLLLYALGRTGSALIELHGVLERRSIDALLRLIVIQDKKSVGQRALERLTLPDLATMLVEVDVLEDSDKKFAEKISGIRNSLSHRNPVRVSKLLMSGKSLDAIAIDAVVEDIDFVPFAVDAIKYLIKLFDWQLPSAKNDPT